jgi:hypothetical protein
MLRRWAAHLDPPAGVDAFYAQVRVVRAAQSATSVDGCRSAVEAVIAPFDDETVRRILLLMAEDFARPSAHVPFDRIQLWLERREFLLVVQAFSDA